MYAWLLGNNEYKSKQVTPELLFVRDSASMDFVSGIYLNQGTKSRFNDISAISNEFEERLKDVFKNFFDPSVPYTQTTVAERCKFCAYSGICNKND